jgi:A/G-specific adenine glycosylase
VRQFQKTIWEYYREHGRELPWRGRITPYRVVVSEVMLQQTQVGRVLQKYPLFLRAFSGFTSLSRSSLREVMVVWQGLGYNRRAKYLRELARVAVREYRGRLPRDYGALSKLPGIGAHTAGAVCAFAWNMPVVFLETNIRSVFLHFFFSGREGVKDSEILPLVESTLDRENPREWYWALMDYGAMLKLLGENPSRRSAHYVKQSPFAGSDREIRGGVMRELVHGVRTLRELVVACGKDEARVRRVLGKMEEEGMVLEKEGKLDIV